VLGEHVEQSGSLVATDRLRFDFTHQGTLAPRELDMIEARVNELVRLDLVISGEEMGYKRALASGAKAFFQDKYGDKVRLVSIGEQSRELCGGTHLERSGQIGLFKLVAQSAVAAGIRRLEAVTGGLALERVQQLEDQSRRLAEILGVGREAVEERVKQLGEKIRGFEKGESKQRSSATAAKSAALAAAAREIAGVKLLSEVVDGASVNELRELGDKLRGQLEQGVIVLAGKTGDKAVLLIMVTKGLVKKFPAGKLMKQAAAAMGAKGGGRPDMAQGGGDAAKLAEAFEAVEKMLAG